MEIDKSNLKQNLLSRKFVDPKVRTLIDDSPFTLGYYNRAKLILTTKFDRSSEVANVSI